MSAWIVAFRRLLCLFHEVVRDGVGSISFVRMGRGDWPNLGGLALVGIHIFPCTNSLISDIAMVIYMLSLVLAGQTLGVTPPLPVAPYHEYM